MESERRRLRARELARELAKALDGGWLDDDLEEGGQPFSLHVETRGARERVVITGPWVEEGFRWPA